MSRQLAVIHGTEAPLDITRLSFVILRLTAHGACSGA
jgi:hypothetical protein